MNSGRFSDDELVKLREEFHACQDAEKDARALLRQLAKDVRCLHDHMELYRPFLEGAIKGQAEMAALRKAIIEKTTIGLIWAAIAGLSVLLYYGMIEHLRALFGHR